MKKIAIFASGNGTNAENICNYFINNKSVGVVLLATNNQDSFVVERIKKFNIPVFSFSREELNNTKVVQKKLLECSVDLIVLSGFLLKVPENIVSLFPNKIINIHPSLLPKFGGIGMYGENVSRSVIDAKEIQSGITIHYVNNNYDEGNVIFQEKFPLVKNESLESLLEKIRVLEMRFFPVVIEKVINSL
ncbi:MAG: phosphoribosylglycinamide formyltransferase [Flavobacterium sp.]|jgi:phosphoribosylglycinamide formyltransferase 1|nr:phosphoribosylglycinamide formyltransferase [Flavobacterium sp.]